MEFYITIRVQKCRYIEWDSKEVRGEKGSRIIKEEDRKKGNIRRRWKKEPRLTRMVLVLVT